MQLAGFRRREHQCRVHQLDGGFQSQFSVLRFQRAANGEARMCLTSFFGGTCFLEQPLARGFKPSVNSYLRNLFYFVIYLFTSCITFLLCEDQEHLLFTALACAALIIESRPRFQNTFSLSEKDLILM